MTPRVAVVASVAAVLSLTVLGAPGVARADSVAPPPRAHASIPATPSTGGSVGAQSLAPAGSTPLYPGYWQATAAGGVSSFGAINYGQLQGVPLKAPIVSMAVPTDGAGYWLVASDGGIFTFGNTAFYGSTGNIRLNRPIVGMAATPDGKGYWLVASDGGIFAFGDAGFYGSTGNLRLNQPVVGMAAGPGGGGYWLVASDGGIFAFGGAGFYGSTGNLRLAKPIVGMTATPDRQGYWFVASDGGIFSYGDAPFLGSGAGASSSPVVAMGAADVNPYPNGAVGYDISWPQCGGALPAPGGTVSIVGLNGGQSPHLAAVEGTPYAWNACFQQEAANAGANLSVYVNVDNTAGETASTIQGAQQIGAEDATADIEHVNEAGFHPHAWWLDVEAPCNYSGNQPALWLCGPDAGGTAANQALNAAVIQGLVGTLQAQGYQVGIYCTYLQWPATVGGTAAGNLQFPGSPIWVAGAASASQLVSYCADPSKQFAGGVPYLVQWAPENGNGTPYDMDRACV